MKISICTKILLLSGALAVAGLTAATADDAPPPPPPPPGGGAPLTPEEHAELKKDHDQALAQNPDLQAQDTELKKEKAAMGPDATPEAKQALHAKMKDFNDKLKAAILKIDPTAGPLLAKMGMHHHPPGGGGQGGAGGGGGGGDAGGGAGGGGGGDMGGGAGGAGGE